MGEKQKSRSREQPRGALLSILIFAGGENGARNATILFSLVASCQLSDVDPLACFRAVLTRLKHHPADRLRCRCHAPRLCTLTGRT